MVWWPLAIDSAMDFPSQKALKDYLEEHPNADKRNHRVVSPTVPDDEPKELDDDEVLQFMEDHGEGDSYSESEKKAVNTYINGVAYVSINAGLRGINGKSLPKHHEETVKHLDQVLAKSKVKKSLVASRGVAYDHPVGKLIQEGRLEPGMVIEDKGFVSTPIKPWKDFQWDNGGLKLKIEIPKGSHGAFIGGQLGEAELLLPRGTKMRVKHVVEDSVTLELINGKE